MEAPTYALAALYATYKVVDYIKNPIVVKKSPQKSLWSKMFNASPKCKTGVNISSFLNIEDYFNEDDSCSKDVEDVSGGLQGKSLQPVINNSLGFKFSSEGHLVTLLGGNALNVISEFRDTFITEEDFRYMYNIGIKRIRLPVGWWIFEFNKEASYVKDPYCKNVHQVRGSKELLIKILNLCVKYEITVMIDLHAVQGGASLSSCNGVHGLSDPVFWDNEEVPDDVEHFLRYPNGPKNKGLATWLKIVKWTKNLPDRLKAAIHGLSPLNEPAHLMPIHHYKMISWMSAACEVFKKVFYGSMYKGVVPSLYINMIQTAWPDRIYNNFEADIFMFMMKNVRTMPSSKTYLDVHNYIAWDYHGDQRYAIYPKDLHSLREKFSNHVATIGKRERKSRGYFKIAISEWSAAWTNLSGEAIKCPRAKELAGELFKFQEDIYSQHDSYFSSLKMPGGKSHKHFWSLIDIIES
jgi:hypothetical protein